MTRIKFIKIQFRLTLHESYSIQIKSKKDIGYYFIEIKPTK